jgi:hypothetical protein
MAHAGLGRFHACAGTGRGRQAQPENSAEIPMENKLLAVRARASQDSNIVRHWGRDTRGFRETNGEHRRQVDKGGWAVAGGTVEHEEHRSPPREMCIGQAGTRVKQGPETWLERQEDRRVASRTASDPSGG